MHAPDGFLNVGTAVTTGAVSAGAIGASLRHMRTSLADRQVPLAGLAAAFIFAAQMINFPVAAGTTGHLLGGALAAILLGPATGAVVVTVVVVVQALAFADGGLTALGYNVLNMALVTAFGGYAIFVLSRRLLPDTATGVIAATALAAGLSVPLSAMAFAIEWLFGATAPVPFDTVFGAVVGVHVLIGIGEGAISAMAIGAVLAARPDLVHGARDLSRAQTAQRSRVGMRAVAIGVVLVALVIAAVVSQFAATQPDGLERVAIDQGFMVSADDHALASGPFADYATAGVRNERSSLVVAGVAGVTVTLLVGLGIGVAVRDRRPGGSAASRRPTDA